MAVFGRIRRRLALALGLTALIPVLAAIWLAESTVRRTSARFFVPEVGERLDQSLIAHKSEVVNSSILTAPTLFLFLFCSIEWCLSLMFSCFVHNSCAISVVETFSCS
jgi:hypothetical protein